MAKVSALIVSAGQGKRMGGRISKQYLEVAGRPLLAYTLEKFQAHPLIEDIVVVTREEERGNTVGRRLLRSIVLRK